tara:strand:- start:5349 stop:5966 length:618 start_codon:yes stop_codon:yes gene_type:complete
VLEYIDLKTKCVQIIKGLKNMKKLLFVTLTASFVVACGGGGDGGSSANAGNTPETLTREQIEVKFNLPIEPIEEVNNSTIEGVDSNGIRGRDDVERAITFEYYKDEVKLNHLYSLLEAEQNISMAFQGQDELKMNEALNEISRLNSCYIFSYREKGGVDLKQLDSLIENTPERVKFTLSIRSEQKGSFKELIEDCKKRGFTNMPI